MMDDLVEDIYIIDDPDAWDKLMHRGNMTVLEIPFGQGFLPRFTERYRKWLLDKLRREAHDGNATGQQES